MEISTLTFRVLIYRNRAGNGNYFVSTVSRTLFQEDVPLNRLIFSFSAADSAV